MQSCTKAHECGQHWNFINSKIKPKATILCWDFLSHPPQCVFVPYPLHATQHPQTRAVGMVVLGTNSPWEDPGYCRSAVLQTWPGVCHPVGGQVESVSLGPPQCCPHFRKPSSGERIPCAKGPTSGVSGFWVCFPGLLPFPALGRAGLWPLGKPAWHSTLTALVLQLDCRRGCTCAPG